MSVKKLATAAIAAVSMAVVPVSAMAAPGKDARPAAAKVRAGAAQTGASKLSGEQTILAIVAALAIGTAILIAANGNSKPTSP